MSTEKKAIAQKKKGVQQKKQHVQNSGEVFRQFEWKAFLFCKICGRSQGRWQYKVSDWESDSHLLMRWEEWWQISVVAVGEKDYEYGPAGKVGYKNGVRLFSTLLVPMKKLKKAWERSHGESESFLPFHCSWAWFSAFQFCKIFFIDFVTDILSFLCVRENERLVHEFEFNLLENEVDLCQSCLFYSKYILWFKVWDQHLHRILGEHNYMFCSLFNYFNLLGALTVYTPHITSFSN